MTENTDHCKDTRAERLITMLTTAVGPQMGELLTDPQVVELMLNADGNLWADRLGKGREFTGHRIQPADAERIIKLVASSTGAEVNEQSPILSAEFPGCESDGKSRLIPDAGKIGQGFGWLASYRGRGMA